MAIEKLVSDEELLKLTLKNMDAGLLNIISKHLLKLKSLSKKDRLFLEERQKLADKVGDL